MKKRLLISGLGGSLFPYLHNQLESDYELFYVDSDISLGNIYKELNFFPAPLVNDSLYEEFIENLIYKYNIDVYIPLIDEEILKAHNIKKRNDHIILISPKKEFCKLALNKYELMQNLKNNNISSLDSYTGNTFNNNLSYPIFAKPIYGRGSRGIRVINSAVELEAYYILERYVPEEVLLQSNVKGQEYTIGVLVNNNNDILSISSKKVIKKKGITLMAVTEDSEVIEKVIFKINNHLRPSGPYNVQLFLTGSNEIKIFEINPRFSTTSIMSFQGGVNEIDLYLKFYNKSYEGEILRPKSNIVLHRRWENLFYEKG